MLQVSTEVRLINELIVRKEDEEQGADAVRVFCLMSADEVRRKIITNICYWQFNFKFLK